MIERVVRVASTARPCGRLPGRRVEHRWVHLVCPASLPGTTDIWGDIAHLRYDVSMDAGSFVRELRERHRLSQAALAYRAGTRQQAISRIEQGLVSPTIDMVTRLAGACGEELVLDARSRAVPFEDAQLAEQAALTMGDRLELAVSWDRFAGEIAGKALKALDER
jgi:transcriptional regulator with XRE-family HTH domain